MVTSNHIHLLVVDGDKEVISKNLQLNIRDDEQLRWVYKQLMEEALAKCSRNRQPEWTESIAVGSRAFVEGIKKKL